MTSRLTAPLTLSYITIVFPERSSNDTCQNLAWSGQKKRKFWTSHSYAGSH